MENYKVYYHKVPASLSGYDHDKYYIGITRREDPNVRFGKNGNNYKGQTFYNAVKKYGWENIEHKILFDNLNAEQAKTIEMLLIQALKSDNNVYGYNNTVGGDGLCSKDRKSVHPVYCKELHMLFRTARVASSYTGDPYGSILSKCNYKCPKGGRSKYTYCFIEDMHKIKDSSNRRHGSIPVVLIKSGELFFSKNEMVEKLGRKFRSKKYLTCDEYINKLTNGKLYNHEYIMKAEDYVKFFDFTSKTLQKPSLSTTE